MLVSEHITIIDKFLSYPDFINLRDLIYYKEDFLYHIHRSVAYDNDVKQNWNWYGTHMFYQDMKPNSKFFSIIDELFTEKMNEKLGLHTYYRVKGNFYPWTETLKEHPWHTDYTFPHKGALFSLNTCDGYTEFEDGTKVESVENRMLLFNPCIKHRSTTTTNDKGRYNINFNYF
jgi:hypothetical protein